MEYIALKCKIYYTVLIILLLCNYCETIIVKFLFINSIRDVKVGVRTFLETTYLNESELKPRHDLYLRMIEVSPDEPTELEHRMKSITKTRYMRWREKSTCSSTLGFRIEAIKVRVPFE